ncbi:MAG: UvrD-helicase domain-containing protein [Candidatus Aminicenantes bacterium]|nr:UvrD-helicase domain-containing protein [Candidatus Aminicenantes bacterium]
MHTAGSDVDILAGLTSSQRTAVVHGDGPMLVLAGPGSGKTRVITHRIAHLIKGGVRPDRILALTFTNKAAEEMRGRLRTMDVPPGATLCTFHSLCVRVLREFAGRAALPPGFSIYDQADQKAVLADVLKDEKLDPKDFPPGRVLRQISVLKNHLITPDQAAVRGLTDLPAALLGSISAAYQKKLEAAGALDFDDLLARASRLLEADVELRERLTRRYRYLLVDEYQDTNTCQYRIARALASGHDNLFVTGDPDQSIYGWRGADIENILAFERDFPAAPVVRLEENFRSSPQVLLVADELIKANARRKEKTLIARKPGGNPPRLYRFLDERDEARGTATWIRGLHEGQGVDYRRIAVFYRTNSMSRVIEEALIQAAVPYQIVKGVEFFHRREVKDMLAYLRLLLNPADEVSLLRVVNRPARGIGDTTVGRLAARAKERGKGLWDILRDPAGVPGLLPAAAVRIGKFAALIGDLGSRLDRPVAEIAREVYIRSGLKDAFVAEKDRDAAENVEELIRSAAQFDADESETRLAGGLAGYLQQTALISDIDSYDEGAGAVSLMTLHSAKGLEFDAVMIVGVEEGIIPHVRSSEDGRDTEEERRLLFVGITRAERFLALSHAMSRAVYGGPKPAVLSSFVRNLRGLEVVAASYPFGPSERADRAPSSPSGFVPDWAKTAAVTPAVPAEEMAGFRVGQRVRHPALGTGRIESFVPGGTAGRAVIQFDQGARLIMGLLAAKLEALD